MNKRNNETFLTPVIKRPVAFLLTVLLLGWLFDFLFWKQALPAVNLTVFFIFSLIAGTALLVSEGRIPPLHGLLLYPFIIFFAVMLSLRLEPLSTFLSLSFCLILTGVLAASYATESWLFFTFKDYLVRLLNLMASFVGGGVLYILDQRGKLTRKNGWIERLKPLWPVLRGIMLALPILAVLTALLVSADLVFSQRLDNLANLFRLERVPEYLFRTFYVLLLALFLGGLLLHAAGLSRAEKIHIEGVKPGWPPPFVGFTESMIVLGSVIALFAGFVSVQLQYYFGGEKNIGVEGYTYAEYARRGFGELIAVAVIILIVLLGLSFFGRRRSRRDQMIFASSGAVVVGLVLLILASAFQRLLLYEAAYGFSRYRTYTHVFMIWLGVLLVLVILLEILRKQRQFALIVLMTSLGFAITVNVMNVDNFIAHRNVQRAADGKELDIAVDTLVHMLTNIGIQVGLMEFGSDVPFRGV